MNKENLKKILIVSAAVAAVAGGAAVIYNYYKRKKIAEERAIRLADANAYILGGGVSALSSAIYLARDCGFCPSHVHILKSGVYDRGNEATGYIARRGKILDEANSPTFFDLMSKVRSVDIPDLTVCDEILNLYTAKGALRPITFIDEAGNVSDISDIKLDRENRKNIINLLNTKKEVLVSLPLTELFGEDFFNTSFFKLVCATYGFDKGSNAYEFINALSYMDKAISGTIPAYFDRNDEIIEPLEAYAREIGIDVRDRAVVTDVDFEEGRARAVHFADSGVRQTVYLNEDDICIMPTDEMAECESLGDFNSPAPISQRAPFALWQRLAEKHAAFKNPSALFCGDKHMSVEFTVTLSNHMLKELIDKVTCEALGMDGVIVLDNSNWKMTIASLPPSYFKDLSDEVSVIWGCATHFRQEGEYIQKPMTQCSGEEILYELAGCLNLTEVWKDIRETVINVIPLVRRYDKAYLAPVASNPEIIPTGISNFAISGDFANGEGSVFTEEFQVKTAKAAAYCLSNKHRHFKLKSKLPSSGIKKMFRKNFR